MYSCMFCGKKMVPGASLHLFPHPEKRPKAFAAWISKVPFLKAERPMWVYKNKRVCTYHFEDHQLMTGHRISVDAVPTKYLDGNVPHSNINEEHNYCNVFLTGESIKPSEDVQSGVLIQSNDFDDHMPSPEYLDTEDMYEKLKVEVFQNIDDNLEQVTNWCRTCLAISPSEYVRLEDDFNLEEGNVMEQPTKLIEMLVSLGCIKELGDENWPQNVCKECAIKIITAYKFQITCLKSTTELLSHLSANSSENTTEINDTKEIFDNYNAKASQPEIEEMHVDDSPTETFTQFCDEQIHIDSPLIEDHMEKNNTKKKVRNKASKIYPLKYKDNVPLKSHVNYKHTRSKNKTLQQYDVVDSDHTCKLCGVNYITESMLKDHMKISHSDCYYIFLCDICGSNECSHDNLYT